MIYRLFSIYDTVLETYHLPFAAVSDREAMRTLHLSMLDEQSMLYQSANDYTLYEVGSYDDSNANYINNLHIHTIRLSEIKNQINLNKKNQIQDLLTEQQQSNGEYYNA
ncbi:MAG: nonstructural protein [Microvirus sp.]|nr:MAG: nonstructural protein [Microvirus sp.]